MPQFLVKKTIKWYDVRDVPNNKEDREYLKLAYGYKEVQARDKMDAIKKFSKKKTGFGLF